MRISNILATVVFTAAAMAAAPTHVGAQASYGQAGRPLQSAATAARSAGQLLQDPRAIVAEVEALLLDRAQQLPGTPQVAVTPPRITRQAACEQMETFLSNPQLRSRMSVGVRCVAPEPWSLYVQASVSVQGYYYVTNRSINVGETITLDDLTAKEGDLLRLARGVIVDPSHAIGYIAQQRIGSGNALRSSALRDPDSVVRGQAVKTEARGMGFVATGEGVALEDGAPGTLIQVRTSSGQVVTGTVVNSTTVRVLM